MVQFECPLGSETPVSYSLLESSLFPFSAPAPSLSLLSGVIRNGLLWETGKKVNFFGTISVDQAANGPA